MAWMTREGRRRRWSSERGAELIEFALVFPLLLLLILGIVDFGFLFQRYEVVTNAAREGARIAVLPGYSDDDVRGRVLSYIQAGGLATTADNLTIDVASVPISTSPGGPTMNGREVRVTYTHQYLLLGPIAGWFGGSFGEVPLRAVSVMRVEVPVGG